MQTLTLSLPGHAGAWPLFPAKNHGLAFLAMLPRDFEILFSRLETWPSPCRPWRQL